MMRVSRRDFVKSASLAGACLAASPSMAALEIGGKKNAEANAKKAYKYRIAFSCWINDMREDPLPLQNWPAPQLDDETINSAIKALDVQSEAGFNTLESFGLFATYGYPPDIVGAFSDKDRRQQVKKLIEEANKRGMTVNLGMGLFSWGYDQIIEHTPAVRGVDKNGNPHPHAMCGAKEEAWKYVEKILDCALGDFDFGGVHLESADLGCCMCPQCAGKYGRVGYNCRLNIRAADYIHDKWPDKFVSSIPIAWIKGNVTPFTPEEEEHVVEMSKHIDCFMDQGWAGTIVPPDQRKAFIEKLHCDYGTSGGIWMCPCVRRNRLSYFLPYPKGTGNAIKQHYKDGARGSMIYQAPVINPATEVNIAVAGRILSDTTRNVEDVLAEVIEKYYRPRNPQVLRKLVDVYLRSEDVYFENWPEEQKQRPCPGEFHVTNLLGEAPGKSHYLFRLTPRGYGAYRNELISILRDLAGIKDDFEDHGRIRRMKTCIINVLVDIDNIDYVLRRE